jgi:glycosyltransferase involved in cell wall biosynthesis
MGSSLMRNRPGVSVIIPTFNRAGVIGETIDSVLAQTYRDTEIIIVDDGSTDDTAKKLSIYGNRIRIVYQENAGTSAARNRGIEVSNAKIIAFQDSDDLWKPTKLERQVSLLARLDSSVPCCLCNAIMQNLYGDGRELLSFDISGISSRYPEGLWLNVTEVLASRSVLFNQTVAVRREALEKVGGFDPKLRNAEDYDLSLRLSLEGPWGFIAEPLTIWRAGASNSLSKMAVQDQIRLKENEIKIFERMLARVKDTGQDRVERLLNKRLGEFRRRLALARLAHAKSGGAQFRANVLNTVENYRTRIAGKLSKLPKMDTKPIAEAQSASPAVQLV